LAPEVQRRLFAEPFFTTKPRRRGFGLAVAYGILHAHRGGLRLHAGERGVVARVLLPVAAHPPAPALLHEAVGQAPVPATPGGRAGRGEKVLVVDDERAVLEFVSATLEGAGYRPQVAHNGEEALQACAGQAQDPFRLVVTDVRMPGLGGVELARRLLVRDPATRVLFMTGYTPADPLLADLSSQCDMLPKPFRAEALLQAVRAALDRPVRRGARGGSRGGSPGGTTGALLSAASKR
jgi:CheY-like chemotaxis protein